MEGSLLSAKGLDPISVVDYSRYGNMIAAVKFSIPDSRPRSYDSNDITQPARSNTVQDSVELARNSPELIMPQTYAPETTQRALVPKNESTDAPGFEKRGSRETNDAVDGEAEADNDDAAETDRETAMSGHPLDQGEQRQLQDLKARDQEVRAHEQAHMAAGGQYTGGVSYEYQQGPDGKRYAVGGEVAIDISAEREPEATIAKMRQVRSAALAPAEPSPQDRSVAARAARTEAEARQELRQKQQASDAEGANGGQGGGIGRLSTNRDIDAHANNGVEGSPYRQSASSTSAGRTLLDVVA